MTHRRKYRMKLNEKKGDENLTRVKVQKKSSITFFNTNTICVNTITFDLTSMKFINKF